MLRSCIICRVEESRDLQLPYCAICQSASYCSKACQRKDWRKQHKQICKFLNVGHGDMQVRTPFHTRHSNELNKQFEKVERSLDEDDTRFFEFLEHSDSTFEESQAAARKMRKIAAHSQFLSLLDNCVALVRRSQRAVWTAVVRRSGDGYSALRLGQSSAS
jgi:hypothetical protein